MTTQINGACFKCKSQKQKDQIISFLVHSGFKQVERHPTYNGDFVVAKCYHEKVVIVCRNNHIADCLQCGTIVDFIAQVRNIAKVWECCGYHTDSLPARLYIVGLPHHLKLLAWCRYFQAYPTLIERDESFLKKAHVSNFVWADTNEGASFWSDLVFGLLTPRLYSYLFLFDMERWDENSNTYKTYQMVIANANKLNI